jgi:hypothetical protein
MKKNYRPFTVAIVHISLVVCFAGCATLQPVPYSFVEETDNSASILFLRGNPDASLVYYDNKVLPSPEKGTVWNPVSFPAAKALEFTVHAYYEQSSNTGTTSSLLGNLIVAVASSAITASRYVKTDVLFRCPPLDTGKDYSLEFRKGSGTTGSNTLILTDVAAGKIIYQQEFQSK